MGLYLDNTGINAAFDRLSQTYRIFAPVRIKAGGRFSDTDNIQYGEVKKVNEIIWEEKSHFSPNEVINPITQTLFHFNEDRIIASTVDDRKILLFLRPCDIHGMQRLDDMFLRNGNNADYFYKRLRDKVKFAMFECKEGWENCFCVTMGTNVTQSYDIAFRFDHEGASLLVKDSKLLSAFLPDAQENNFEPEFIRENQFTIDLPESTGLSNEEIRHRLIDHPMWDEYDHRCIECGRCTTSCPTCSCHNVNDVTYNENSRVGERQRVWASCIVPHFSDMAGGHSYRQRKGERLRYRLLHKVVDHRERFGENMCVGCGRCDDRCPQYISFAGMIQKATNAIKEVNHG
ncbi:Anaerobic sulfite reductase subunit A [invertebrate metagenome]|uniref:Anaerobic sulfite reductase subunit A n=1 Tax=invertebrate metagenome TaxID=1711999 RepID=A0A2H9T9W2_9ZZZZ